MTIPLRSSCKIGWIIVLLALLTNCVPSFADFQDPLIISNAERVELGPHLLVFEDPSGTMMLEELPPQGHADWKAVEESIPSFGYTASSFWFYLVLEAPPADSILVVDNPLLDYVTVHWRAAGRTLERFQTGDRYPFAQRPENHRLFLFPPPVTDEKTVELYVRVASATSIQVPMTLWKREAFHSHEDELRGLRGVYAGLMLGMILYNGFLLLALRDRSYLFYVLYMGFPVLYFGAMHGLLYATFWPESPLWNEFILALIVFGSVGFSALFTDSFLDLGSRRPVLHQTMTGIAALAGLGMAVGVFVPFRVLAAPMALLVVASGVIYMAAGLIMLRAGYRPARYYLLAWAVFILAVVVFALAKLGVLPSNVINANAPLIGSAIEAVLLSFGLADRFNLFREQAEQAVQERLRAESEGQYRRAASLRTLITGVAHQLNTPLGNGVAVTSLILDESRRIRRRFREGREPSMEELSRFTDRTVDASRLALGSFERACGMVERFKQVAVEGHREPLTEFDLRDRLEKVLSSTRPILSERGISIDLSCPTQIKCHGFPIALEDVLAEVICNAATHAFDDVERPHHIDVSAEVDETTIRIVIQDNGVGIGVSDPQRLLDPFFTTKRGEEGRLGLGLYIAYGVVTDRLGGNMSLDSRDVGLAVILSFPRWLV